MGVVGVSPLRRDNVGSTGFDEGFHKLSMRKDEVDDVELVPGKFGTLKDEAKMPVGRDKMLAALGESNVADTTNIVAV